MPIHDWQRVSAGIFHHFHNAWINEISDALNDGILPEDYYALGEQVAGPINPDVLTLHVTPSNGPPAGLPRGAMAVGEFPPRVRLTMRSEKEIYSRKQSALVIRHSSDDRIIALAEILSAGNKSSTVAVRAVLDKAISALKQGIHLLLVDLHPPTSRDPRGIHGVLWSELVGEDYEPPSDKPLTLAAYTAGLFTTAYVEPVAVGDRLPDMPLFLAPEAYVSVPLEATYQAAFKRVPQRWRKVLEA